MLSKEERASEIFYLLVGKKVRILSGKILIWTIDLCIWQNPVLILSWLSWILSVIYLLWPVPSPHFGVSIRASLCKYDLRIPEVLIMELLSASLETWTLSELQSQHTPVSALPQAGVSVNFCRCNSGSGHHVPSIAQ